MATALSSLLPVCIDLQTTGLQGRRALRPALCVRPGWWRRHRLWRSCGLLQRNRVSGSWLVVPLVKVAGYVVKARREGAFTPARAVARAIGVSAHTFPILVFCEVAAFEVVHDVYSLLVMGAAGLPPHPMGFYFVFKYISALAEMTSRTPHRVFAKLSFT